MAYKSGGWGKEAKERSKERKEYFTNYHMNRKFGKYGINQEVYNSMFEQQKGVCLICKQPETARYSNGSNEIKKLSIDHNHSTGEVRGLLCFNCNRGLGHFKDSPKLLREAINYLK